MLDGVFTRRSKTSVDSENYEVRRFVNIFTSPHTFILIASLCRVGRRAVRRFWQYERVDSTRTLLQRSLWWNRLYCTLLTHVRGQYVLGSSRPLQLSVYCWFLSCEHLKKLAFIHIVSKGFFLCEASRIFIVQSCTFSAYFWRFYTANNPFPPDFRYLNTCRVCPFAFKGQRRNQPGEVLLIIVYHCILYTVVRAWLKRGLLIEEIVQVKGRLHDFCCWSIYANLCVTVALFLVGEL